VAWLALSVLAYGATYFSDPYVFAFTVLGVGTLSFGIALVGVLGAVIGLVTNRSKLRDCGILLVLSLLIALTSMAAFRILQGFRWT
jgi:hypothetical protein